jgi:hypothetical protein
MCFGASKLAPPCLQRTKKFMKAAMLKAGFLDLEHAPKDAPSTTPFFTVIEKIMEVAVVTDAENEGIIKPCGACLQYISDFAESPEIKIVMAKVENAKVLFEMVKVKTLKELFPEPFKK